MILVVRLSEVARLEKVRGLKKVVRKHRNGAKENVRGTSVLSVP